jgi:hypothetical protein
LPLLVLLFWLGGGWIINERLSQSDKTMLQIQSSSLFNISTTHRVVSIAATLYQQQGVTKVTVKTDNPTLKDLKFEFPFIHVHDLEAAISQELKLSLAEVRRLVHYRVKD